jgi:hypothetical protein
VHGAEYFVVNVFSFQPPLHARRYAEGGGDGGQDSDDDVDDFLDDFFLVHGEVVFRVGS